MFNVLKRLSVQNAFLIALTLLLVYAFAILPLKPFQVIKLRLEDLLSVTTFHVKDRPPELEDLVLVGLDDESLVKVNQRWPWERSIIAELVDKIASQKPRLILLDFAFVGESKDPRSDQRLAESFKRAGNVVIAYHVGEYGKPAFPLENIRKASLGVGFVNRPLDRDFTIRRARACYRTVDGVLVNEFGYAIEVISAAHYFGASPFLSEKENLLTFQKKEEATVPAQGWKVPMPVATDGTLPLNYQARPEHFTTYPVWSVLSDRIPPNTFTDKLVVAGVTNRLLHDIHNTPFGSLVGVFIVANFLLMILSGSYVTEATLWLNLLILFLVGLATSYATYRFSLWRGFLFLFYEVASLLGATFFLYVKNIRWDFSSTIIAAVLSYSGISFYKYLCILFENITLREEAITDGLTQLYAYRYLELRLRNEFERAKRYQTPLSLVFIDIDHFKRINDTYGHEEGNLVLKTIAQTLKQNTRRVDLVARYGGEEFCVVLPQTDLEGAHQYAENLRKTIEEIPFILQKSTPLKVTVSIGVASYPRFQVSSSEELVKLTDTALYQAKQGGRNRVCIPDSPGEKLTTH